MIKITSKNVVSYVWGGDNIYLYTPATRTRNGFCNPPPPRSPNVRAYISAFILLIVRQLGVFTCSFGLGGVCNLLKDRGEQSLSPLTPKTTTTHNGRTLPPFRSEHNSEAFYYVNYFFAFVTHCFSVTWKKLSTFLPQKFGSTEVVDVCLPHQ